MVTRLGDYIKHVIGRKNKLTGTSYKLEKCIWLNALLLMKFQKVFLSTVQKSVYPTLLYLKLWKAVRRAKLNISV